ncbi:beta family protein [Paenibacillus sp. DMB5]|uniref:beta family protein n=1 Tax=Paenibacillus sp. DMB5 TaxID=1780103 RepID=UPI00076D3022|nr:beta family protein [Paenibacillus sp. DMB5]KUP23110.1 hypothetical protein AWJ19_22800 [Paenibacillus sp. DMB5]
MFNERHYVPILKWKRGEQVALEKLPLPLKAALTPLIEIVPVTYDYKNDCPKETIDEHLSDFGQQLSKSWGTEKPVFIDLAYLDESETMHDGSHPLEFLFEQVRTEGLRGIPVTGNGRGLEYQENVKKLNSIDKNGVCIRLEDEDFIGTAQILDDLLIQLNVIEEEVDIIIDLGSITKENQSSSVITATAVINSINTINKYRSLTVVGSGFPQNLSTQVSTGTTGSVPRYEWLVWKSIYKIKDKLLRIPTFGDYTINSPDLIEMDPRKMQMAAGIRYTSIDNYYIFRGISIRKANSGGWGQAKALCQEIIKHPCYCGPTFSWGDEYINDCAKGTASTGTAETWRRVGTNHHLTFITNELANFPWT